MLNYFAAYLSIFSFLLNSGCTKEELPDEKRMSQASIVALEISGCKGRGAGQETIEITNQGDKVIVFHRDALFNCCVSEVSTQLEIKNNEIKIYENSSKDRCNCVCSFDVRMELNINEIQPGKITVYRNNLKISSINIIPENPGLVMAD